MGKIRYNKSKTYLLPLLSELIELDARFFNHLINTYIYDDSSTYKKGDHFYILHDFSFKNPEFTAYERKITNNQYFVDLIDIDNKVLYIFKFPEDYKKEYDYFKEGKYSKFGTDAKNIILNFFGKVYSGNLNAVAFLLKVKQILFKDKKLKEQIEKDLKVILSTEAELTDIMDKDNETFKLSDLKKKKENSITGNNINLNNNDK